MDWMRKMISNLYKIKWGEEESKYKKEKKKWRKCNSRCKLIRRRRVIYLFLYIIRIGRRKV